MHRARCERPFHDRRLRSFNETPGTTPGTHGCLQQRVRPYDAPIIRAESSRRSRPSARPRHTVKLLPMWRVSHHTSVELFFEWPSVFFVSDPHHDSFMPNIPQPVNDEHLRQIHYRLRIFCAYKDTGSTGCLYVLESPTEPGHRATHGERNVCPLCFCPGVYMKLG